MKLHKKLQCFLSSAVAVVCTRGSVSGVGDGGGAEFTPEGARRGSGSCSPAAEICGTAHTGQDITQVGPY